MSVSKTEMLRKINEQRMKLVEYLEPCDGDYVFGGSHRMWVIGCAILTADEYIKEQKEMSEGLSEVLETEADLILPYSMAIPMPPAWNGVRPAEIFETYGHPASEGKDWRHFENTLRWRFATKGYMCDTQPMNGKKGIAFVAQTMIQCLNGMPDISKVGSLNDYKHTATTPKESYDDYCEECDKFYQNTKSADLMVGLSKVPMALRPIVAMSMC